MRTTTPADADADADAIAYPFLAGGAGRRTRCGGAL
jgi:hypothetical protein